MATKQELMEENDALLQLLEDIDSAVELPGKFQDRIEDFLGSEEEDDDAE